LARLLGFLLTQPTLTSEAVIGSFGGATLSFIGHSLRTPSARHAATTTDSTITPELLDQLPADYENPLRPGSPGLPRHSGAIFVDWASVKTIGPSKA
jgi:hypothetical protein